MKKRHIRAGRKEMKVNCRILCEMLGRKGWVEEDLVVATGISPITLRNMKCGKEIGNAEMELQVILRMLSVLTISKS